MVYGVDASPAMVAAFHERFPQAHVMCEAVEDSDLFGRTFDAVVAWGLFFLLAADAQVALIRRVASALLPRGSFLFTSPEPACTWTDMLTGRQSVSLGSEGYRTILAAAGLELLAEYQDEGENHYYEARKPEETLRVTDQIRFNDGAAYERYMGAWSQLAGEIFLDWLAPESGLRWLDIGCGNGAFTEMLVERCAPVSVQGIDPSEEQLAYARKRFVSRIAQFRQGDAMALPFPDDTFDASVMPLVIFFVPDPAQGVAEMVRVVRPGGTVTAYAWDLSGGGHPYQALQVEMRGMGVAVPVPPNPGASRIDTMRDLWTGAGLEAVETREITVQRTFADFDDYWTAILGGPSVGAQLAAMASEDLAVLQARMRARLPVDATGRIICKARANAVKGHVPH